MLVCVENCPAGIFFIMSPLLQLSIMIASVMILLCVSGSNGFLTMFRILGHSSVKLLGRGMWSYFSRMKWGSPFRKSTIWARVRLRLVVSLGRWVSS